MASHSIHSDPVTVGERLEQLGLTQETLRESIFQAHLQRMRLTPNHPRIFAGLEMWRCGDGLSHPFVSSSDRSVGSETMWAISL